MRLQKIPREFYLRQTLSVARDLLGLFFVRKIGRELLIGRIVEVEAYLGEKDPASHAYRGRTERNEVMFREGGQLYVYFTYGMHFCCNVVTESEGRGRAVLIRAVEPMEGISRMIRNRSASGGRAPADRAALLRWLCSGPARTCQAFGIARRQNGTDLCAGSIWLARRPKDHERPHIVRSNRIGISNGQEHRWRFTLKGNPFVSQKTS